MEDGMDAAAEEIRALLKGAHLGIDAYIKSAGAVADLDQLNKESNDQNTIGLMMCVALLAEHERIGHPKLVGSQAGDTTEALTMIGLLFRSWLEQLSPEVMRMFVSRFVYEQAEGFVKLHVGEDGTLLSYLDKSNPGRTPEQIAMSAATIMVTQHFQREGHGDD